MVTLREATNLEAVGRPQRENSWFNGYAWTIVYCGECGDHLGWLFTAARRELQPRRFYGIRRSAISESSVAAEDLACIDDDVRYCTVSFV